MLSAARPLGGVITLGETLAVVATVHPGPLSVATPLRMSFAGAESTVAIGLARLGHRATWIGRLGDDDAGRMVRRGLLGDGVAVLGGAAESGAATALLLKQQRTADVTRVAYYRQGSAGAQLDESDVDADAIAAAGVLHVTGITAALGPGPARALDRAVTVAREHGTLVSFDVNYRAALWPADQAAPALRTIAERADIVFAGADELRLIDGGEQRDAQQIAADLRSAGVAEVVVKDGAAGVCTFAGDDTVHQPIRVASVVDPVGAGDAFVAGYLSALLDGLPISERLRRGVALGAVAVSTIGDWEGLPHRDELAALEASTDVLR